MKRQYGEIPLLPALFTLAGVLFGFLSLVFCFQGRYSGAAFWIIMAAIMDALDGIVARSIGAQSEFGVELDSLADAFSFGAAPAVLLYFWGLGTVHTAGVFFSFLYLASAILRLARFNVLQKTQKSRKAYIGLTVPSASLFMASLVLFHPQPLLTRRSAFLLALAIVVISFFMVSTIRYRNYLGFPLRQRINLGSALLVAALIAGFVFYTRIFLLVFFSFNVLSGPASHVFGPIVKKMRRKSGKKHPQPDDRAEKSEIQL
ncbi:MAG: CDP-diacylglycerol--serine O-phosphatidyltransferase [Candidatus Aminicenantes bacterium]|nr:CDP-diacylglycerol--serine O-phosphatidyltransferase [Candidatus Aminicenantes bacterium]